MPSPHPAMPPEALVRQTRLGSLIKEMVAFGPSLEPAALQLLRTALTGQASLDVQEWTIRLQAEHLVEEAAEVVRSIHRTHRDEALLKRVEAALAPLVVRAQAKRSAMHHLDSRRTTIRFGFSKQMPALDLDDRDLQAIFLLAFRLEGLIVALDLGKRPHPLLRSPLPLPAGVAGLDERMEVELKKEPADSEASLVMRLQARLPAGVTLHRWEVVPNHASGLGDRALGSHWRWCCPVALAVAARNLAEGFQNSQEDREGFIQSMAWENDTLAFSSRMGPFLATNPMKQLATRLGVHPSDVTGLVRVRVELGPDPRLDQADRFEAKLKNIYEDAVLLGSGSNITLVDDDEDEPIRLG